ncbi:MULTISPECIES: cysteine desulfurase family protein [unclassified Actinopolyspora]|uniref:cysteine desulfurase family protein n=1 Tax=unclassified Actinopolyspora TaxID=2639451 RepID=UPI0013F603E8|nr:MULTISPECIES: cysteine desulfurase family protein [unclassified Actinopolyspora]NHD18375.1 cysteine desulfurase [Actinopolyspora sp. BKK2]NHE77666.1 cysteine desulfurase [Actinopolyspora sp. BKK1]
MTYLDHAATTPMRARAIAVMSDALSTLGNASSLHTSGRRARRAVEESREDIADALGARPSEVLFTAGGTESDNLAVKGIFWARRAADERRRRVLASAVEHHAVLDTVEWLAEHEGAEVTWLEVDSWGRVTPETFERAVREAPDEVALATVMWANNEVGTINPIPEIAEIAERYGVPLHTDAVQAVETLPVDFGSSGVSALTMTGHKIGGPYGVGVLVLSREVSCTPLLHGGGQEREVRSGTLDTPAVVALANALREAVDTRQHHVEELTRLRDRLIAGVREVVPDAVLNGDPGTVEGGRLPGNAHFTFPGCEGDSLLMLLDAKGIECSTGSACTAGVAEPSHVLLAMGADVRVARGSLRLTLGHDSTADDVRTFLEALEPAVRRARSAGLSGLSKTSVGSATAPTEV